jgi:hypothetical protein
MGPRIKLPPYVHGFIDRRQGALLFQASGLWQCGAPWAALVAFVHERLRDRDGRNTRATRDWREPDKTRNG